MDVVDEHLHDRSSPKTPLHGRAPGDGGAAAVPGCWVHLARRALPATWWARPLKGSSMAEFTAEQARENLKNVFDPEIGINIVDLGLVYDVDVSDSGDVLVTMTLTSLGCPLGPVIVQEVTNAMSDLPNLGDVDVKLVWSPAWSPEMMSERRPRRARDLVVESGGPSPPYSPLLETGRGGAPSPRSEGRVPASGCPLGRALGMRGAPLVALLCATLLLGGCAAGSLDRRTRCPETSSQDLAPAVEAAPDGAPQAAAPAAVAPEPAAPVSRTNRRGRYDHRGCRGAAESLDPGARGPLVDRHRGVHPGCPGRRLQSRSPYSAAMMQRTLPHLPEHLRPPPPPDPGTGLSTIVDGARTAASRSR